MGGVEIVTRRVGARAKEGKGEGRRRFSLLSPGPLSAPFDSPHFVISSGVSTWGFREQKHLRARRPALQAKLKIICKLKITTVKPPKYGHQRDRIYRGVRIIEVGNV